MSSLAETTLPSNEGASKGNQELVLPDQEFFTPQEFAELLRMKVPTIYKYVREKKITVYKFGQELRFYRADVEAFLNRHRVPASGETD